MSRKVNAPNIKISFFMEDGKPFNESQSCVNEKIADYQFNYVKKELLSVNDEDKRFYIYKSITSEN